MFGERLQARFSCRRGMGDADSMDDVNAVDEQDRGPVHVVHPVHNVHVVHEASGQRLNPRFSSDTISHSVA